MLRVIVERVLIDIQGGFQVARSHSPTALPELQTRDLDLSFEIL